MARTVRHQLAADELDRTDFKRDRLNRHRFQGLEKPRIKGYSAHNT